MYQYILRLKGIRNSFGKQVVHDNLDLKMRQGEILGLIGGSGTGKSVLLRSVLGLNRPTRGSISLMGLDLLPGNAANWRKARMSWGVLFQDGALFSSLTVAENIQMPLRLYTDLGRKSQEAIAALKIRLVGLPPEAAHKYPSELSGGMRKRAGLARALAMDPQILLLDEPTSGLDPIGAADFDLLLKTLSRAMGLSVLMATHDLDSLYSICDRVAVLADRKIVGIGSIPELLRIKHPWIHEYFQGPRGRAAATAGEVRLDLEPGLLEARVLDKDPLENPEALAAVAAPGEIPGAGEAGAWPEPPTTEPLPKAGPDAAEDFERILDEQAEPGQSKTPEQESGQDADQNTGTGIF